MCIRDREILHSLQPIYGLTAGLSNKTIVKLIHQVLDEQKLQAEYLSDEYKERYHLADRNFAIPAIHFPKNMQELLAARRRLVFDEDNPLLSHFGMDNRTHEGVTERTD